MGSIRGRTQHTSCIICISVCRRSMEAMLGNTTTRFRFRDHLEPRMVDNHSYPCINFLRALRNVYVDLTNHPRSVSRELRILSQSTRSHSHSRSSPPISQPVSEPTLSYSISSLSATSPPTAAIRFPSFSVTFPHRFPRPFLIEDSQPFEDYSTFQPLRQSDSAPNITFSFGPMVAPARAPGPAHLRQQQQLPAIDIESSRSYMDDLFSHDPQRRLDALVRLRNSVIGSNRQKGSVIAQGIVPRLLHFLGDTSCDGLTYDRIRWESAVILGSLAHGNDHHVRSLLSFDVIPTMLRVLLATPSTEGTVSSTTDVDARGRQLDSLNEACLRCLSTLFQHTSAPVHSIFQDPAMVPRLLTLARKCVSNQVCVANILKAACKTVEEQNALSRAGAVDTLAMQLEHPSADVQLPALACLANMSHQNQMVSAMIAVATTSSDRRQGKPVPEALGQLMGRERSPLVQLEAAKCISYMHRAGALPSTHPRVIFRALPCLVRLCHREHPPSERITAAETLAYLTEVDIELQRLASISNHLIPTLAEFLRPHPPIQDAALAQGMRQAAFKAFASLGANDEDIRKRIIETDNLMEQVVSGLQDPGGARVRLAAVRCLHSLSRSVQQLRTSFQDHAVWRPLMQLLHGADKTEGRAEGENDLLTVASSTLCNLLLEFSPSKEPILESGGVELLCSLTKRPEPALRLNGIWALMNVAFQAEQRVKSQILSCLGTDQIFRLLADPELAVVMKTLGLLRNLLSTKAHIDRIMGEHAAHVMQAVILVLEDPEHPADVKEQALCILANVADGDRARDHIMANEDVLKKLMDYMMHSNTKLQVAAVFCVCNLVWREEPGAAQRQARLKELGLYHILQQLRQTKDSQLFDKVKSALGQFYDP